MHHRPARSPRPAQYVGHARGGRQEEAALRSPSRVTTASALPLSPTPPPLSDPSEALRPDPSRSSAPGAHSAAVQRQILRSVADGPLRWPATGSYDKTRDTTVTSTSGVISAADGDRNMYNMKLEGIATM